MFVPDAAILQPLLTQSAARHDHLCPRQVLGVRLGLFGLRSLELVDTGYLPRFMNHDKRLLTIIETDGCGVDGIAVATCCEVGRRTLRVEDFGKMAATLVDTYTEQAIRIAPQVTVRDIVPQYAPQSQSQWHAYLDAYQIMPDELMFTVQPVRLLHSLAAMISQPGLRASCERCEEEIMNEREVRLNGQLLCLACAGHAYYTPA